MGEIEKIIDDVKIAFAMWDSEYGIGDKEWESMNTAINLLKNSADHNGWISVKDRLPEEGGKYLVTVTSNVVGKPFVKTAWFLHNLWDNWAFKYDGEPNTPGFYNGDGEGDWVERSVTHWMPLPEPPGKGEVR